MRVSQLLCCEHMNCVDVRTSSHALPPIELNPDNIKILMISEAPPEDLQDYFYSGGDPGYMQTTIQAFGDAGISVSSIHDIIELGVYITTAIKCGKMDYAIATNTVKECSHILEKELSFFPNAEVYMLMGDVAIRAMNYICKRQTGKNVVPSGSTYKIRKGAFYMDTIRVFPSYLQTGGNYLIEKSKRNMIADDLKRAFATIRKESEPS